MNQLFRIIAISVTKLCILLPHYAYAFNDAHIHYNQDVWRMLTPAEAVTLMKQAGIHKALVSSTPTRGTEKLYHEDDQLVVPMLRPYKDYRHRFLWFKDEQLIDYLRQQLKKLPYVGIGEFHVFGADADLQPVAEMIELARRQQLILHAHTDLDGMQRLLNKANDLVLIWAHGGFDVAVEQLRELLARYPHLYIDLAYREGMLDKDKKLTSEWRSFLQHYPDRFLLGSDTYKASRWAQLSELSEQSSHWLNQLPDDVNTLIAEKNLMQLLKR